MRLDDRAPRWDIQFRFTKPDAPPPMPIRNRQWHSAATFKRTNHRRTIQEIPLIPGIKVRARLVCLYDQRRNPPSVDRREGRAFRKDFVKDNFVPVRAPCQEQIGEWTNASSPEYINIRKSIVYSYLLYAEHTSGESKTVRSQHSLMQYATPSVPN